MSRRGTSARLRVAVALAVAVLLLVTGCAAHIVPFGSDTAVDPEGPSETAWYEETRAWIAALRLHASARGPQSAPALRALELLESCVDDLEKAQAAGLSPGELPLLRTICDTQLRLLVQLEAARQRGTAEVSP